MSTNYIYIYIGRCVYIYIYIYIHSVTQVFSASEQGGYMLSASKMC